MYKNSVRKKISLLLKQLIDILLRVCRFYFLLSKKQGFYLNFVFFIKKNLDPKANEKKKIETKSSY